MTRGRIMLFQIVMVQFMTIQFTTVQFMTRNQCNSHVMPFDGTIFLWVAHCFYFSVVAAVQSVSGLLSWWMPWTYISHSTIIGRRHRHLGKYCLSTLALSRYNRKSNWCILFFIVHFHFSFSLSFIVIVDLLLHWIFDAWYILL